MEMRQRDKYEMWCLIQLIEIEYVQIYLW
jgi:hypothetical protein